MRLLTFINKNLIDKLFTSVRNILYCTFILAVGKHIHDHPPAFLAENQFVSYIGLPIIGFGLFLFLLHLADGINEISKLNYNFWLKMILCFIHVYLTVVLLIVVWFYRVNIS